jgi:hypothetical protein
MDGYRSPLIGKLVAARAKATASIKAIIKDKTAKVPTKDGRSYSYAYVDLAGVLDAVSDALAEQELVIVQTTQVRATGTYLLTSLLHSSEQWLASELRLNATSAGPQAFGSELTYLRRYATLGILGLAPEDDDDGAAAQDRADQGRHRQQHRQEGRQRAQDAPETPRGTAAAPLHPQATPVAPTGPTHMPMLRNDEAKPLPKRWAKAALEILAQAPDDADWRAQWLAWHRAEIEVLREVAPDWAAAVEAACRAPAPEQVLTAQTTTD